MTSGDRFPPKKGTSERESSQEQWKCTHGRCYAIHPSGYVIWHESSQDLWMWPIPWLFKAILAKWSGSYPIFAKGKSASKLPFEEQGARYDSIANEPKPPVSYFFLLNPSSEISHFDPSFFRMLGSTTTQVTQDQFASIRHVWSEISVCSNIWWMGTILRTSSNCVAVIQVIFTILTDSPDFVQQLWGICLSGKSSQFWLACHFRKEGCPADSWKKPISIKDLAAAKDATRMFEQKDSASTGKPKKVPFFENKMQVGFGVRVFFKEVHRISKNYMTSVLGHWSK